MPRSLNRRPRPARALAVLAVGLVGSAGALAMPAGANEDFVVGSGRADARILRAGPAAGQLALAPTFGLSLADYVGSLGRGEARVADYAALDGSIPPELKAQAPEVRTESTEENAAAGKSKTFMGTPAGSPITIGAMEQKSRATKDPQGSSSVTLGAIGIPGVIEIGASTATSSAGVIEKKAREARGVTTIESLKLGGGAVTLNGLTWEAVQRTGEGAKVDGSFRVEGLTIAGTKVPVPSNGADLAAVLPQINAALKPTGLVLDAPTVSKDGDFARVTPLGVRMVNSQAGQTVVAPVVGALQPAREPVTGAIINNCSQCKSAILVADVLAGVVTGGGRFDLELGGTTGFTEGVRYESPFNFDFSGLGGGASNDFGGDFAGAEGFGDVGSSPSSFESSAASFGGTTSPVGTTGASSPAAPGVGSGGSTGTLAATNSPIAPGTKGGAAALIGLAGLLGAIALGAADFRAIRAARRTIPTV
ncbi:MAG TPA: hypothetical protein VM345_19095 [Acidimicrobiales bacterium]|nr:hypothetical protein [Acidimicrobiales bacterium]